MESDNVPEGAEITNSGEWVPVIDRTFDDESQKVIGRAKHIEGEPAHTYQIEITDPAWQDAFNHHTLRSLSVDGFFHISD